MKKKIIISIILLPILLVGILISISHPESLPKMWYHQSIKWREMPHPVYLEIYNFESDLEQNTMVACSRISEIPAEVFDWHTNILELIENEFDTDGKTPYFFRKKNNDHLFVWYEESTTNSYELCRFMVNSNYIWNVMTGSGEGNL